LAFRPPFKSMRRSRGEKSSDTAERNTAHWRTSSPLSTR
jgi:hypothetical protein